MAKFSLKRLLKCTEIVHKCLRLRMAKMERLMEMHNKLKKSRVLPNLLWFVHSLKIQSVDFVFRNDSYVSKVFEYVCTKRGIVPMTVPCDSFWTSNVNRVMHAAVISRSVHTPPLPPSCPDPRAFAQTGKYSTAETNELFK